MSNEKKTTKRPVDFSEIVAPATTKNIQATSTIQDVCEQLGRHEKVAASYNSCINSSFEQAMENLDPLRKTSQEMEKLHKILYGDRVKLSFRERVQEITEDNVSLVADYIQKQRKDAERLRQDLVLDSLTEELKPLYPQDNLCKYSSGFLGIVTSPAEESLKKHMQQLDTYQKALNYDLYSSSTLKGLSSLYEKAYKSILNIGDSAKDLQNKLLEQTKMFNKVSFGIDSVKSSLFEGYAATSLEEYAKNIQAKLASPISKWGKEQQENVERLSQSFWGVGLDQTHFGKLNSLTLSSAYSSLLGRLPDLSEYLAENPLTKEEWDLAAEYVSGFANDPESASKLFQETIQTVGNFTTERSEFSRAAIALVFWLLLLSACCERAHQAMFTRTAENVDNPSSRSLSYGLFFIDTLLPGIAFAQALASIRKLITKRRRRAPIARVYAPESGMVPIRSKSNQAAPVLCYVKHDELIFLGKHKSRNMKAVVVALDENGMPLRIGWIPTKYLNRLSVRDSWNIFIYMKKLLKWQ